MVIVIIDLAEIHRKVAADMQRVSLMKSRTAWFNQERYGARRRDAKKVTIQ